MNHLDLGSVALRAMLERSNLPFEGVAPGAHILNGDALAWLGHLPAESVDLIFADPPYFLSGGGTTCRGGQRVSVDKGPWDVPVDVPANYGFHMTWLRLCRQLLRPSGTIWVSGTQHCIFQVGHAMQSLGYHLLNTITWQKPNPPPNLGCRQLTHSSEFVIWAAPYHREPLEHTFHYEELKRENGGKQLRDLWTLAPPGAAEKKHGSHPTQKPLALLDRIVRASSNPGDVVLDPFMGSGTTGVAALALGRRFVGIELADEYVALAQRRLAALAPPMEREHEKQ